MQGVRCSAALIVCRTLAASFFAAVLLAACSVFGGGSGEGPIVKMATVQNVRTVYVNPADERADTTPSGAAIPPAALQAQARFGTGPDPSSPQMPDQTGAAGEDRARRLEITVKLDDGELRAIVQPAAAQFVAGERVKLVAERGRVEVIH
jgi:outer membrane lipoprotein SlyB